MPNQKNIHELAEIEKNLADSQAVILSDYAGLTVSQTGSLRQKATDAGATFLVTKNRLLKIALSKLFPSGLPADLENNLNGPTSATFIKKDIVLGTKAVTAFAADNDSLKIKLGLLKDKVISLTEVIALSKLPSFEQLIASLMAQVQAPATALVRQVNAPAQRLVYVLSALQTKLTK